MNSVENTTKQPKKCLKQTCKLEIHSEKLGYGWNLNFAEYFKPVNMLIKRVETNQIRGICLRPNSGQQEVSIYHKFMDK